MGIDKKTQPTNVWIQIDNVPKYLEKLQKINDKEICKTEKGEVKKLLIENTNHSFEPSEYYLDEYDGKISIQICGNLTSIEGNTYIALVMPLSDIVLIDILAYAVKKLNKLKLAMESLK